MGENLLWLLIGTGLCLLVGWRIHRRRAGAQRDAAAARHRIDEQTERDAAEAERNAAAQREAETLAERDVAARAEAQRQDEHRAVERRLAAQRAEAERIAAARQREAAEQAERERIAALELQREARRLAAERAAREAEARAEAQRQAERRAEEVRQAAERAEAERIAAERRREDAAQTERERLAILEAQREAQRLAAEQAAHEAQARAEAQRLAEQRAEQERLAAECAAALPPRRATKTAAQTLVLVADDSKVVRIKTGRLLVQHQYQVAYANDGLDAVQQMQARLPDLVITDVEMPGMDGFELTRHIRSHPQSAQLPVIMITAADDRHREQADAAGVSVLLGKPYPEDALLAHIRLAMGQDGTAPPAAVPSTHGALDALA